MRKINSVPVPGLPRDLPDETHAEVPDQVRDGEISTKLRGSLNG